MVAGLGPVDAARVLVEALTRFALVRETVLARLDVDQARAARLIVRDLEAAIVSLDASRAEAGEPMMEALHRLGELAVTGHALLGCDANLVEAAANRLPGRPSSRRSDPAIRRPSQPRVSVAKVELTRRPGRPKV